jgi:hypothetical protein
VFQPHARQKQIKLAFMNCLLNTKRDVVVYIIFLILYLLKITRFRSSSFIVLSLLSLLFFPLVPISHIPHTLTFFCSRLEIQKPLGIIEVCQQIIQAKKDYPFPTQIPVLNSNHTPNLLKWLLLLQNPEMVEDTLKLL